VPVQVVGAFDQLHPDRLLHVPGVVSVLHVVCVPAHVVVGFDQLHPDSLEHAAGDVRLEHGGIVPVQVLTPPASTGVQDWQYR